jgi:hypothetical protein
MRIRLAIAVLAVGAILPAVFLGSASATFHWPIHQPTHRCGSFETEYEGTSYENVVFNSKDLSCHLATKVVEAFLEPGAEPHHHGGPSSEESWWTTNRFPKWRCYSGAGGGGCLNRHRQAAYSSTLL